MSELCAALLLGSMQQQMWLLLALLAEWQLPV
jgi:hypothetical protein